MNDTKLKEPIAINPSEELGTKGFIVLSAGNGTDRLRFIKTIPESGLTQAVIEALAEEALERGYSHNPTVDVSYSDFNFYKYGVYSPPIATPNDFDKLKKWWTESGNAAYWDKVDDIEAELGRYDDDTPSTQFLVEISKKDKASRELAAKENAAKAARDLFTAPPEEFGKAAVVGAAGAIIGSNAVGCTECGHVLEGIDCSYVCGVCSWHSPEELLYRVQNSTIEEASNFIYESTRVWAKKKDKTSDADAFIACLRFDSPNIPIQTLITGLSATIPIKSQLKFRPALFKTVKALLAKKGFNEHEIKSSLMGLE